MPHKIRRGVIFDCDGTFTDLPALSVRIDATLPPEIAAASEARNERLHKKLHSGKMTAAEERFWIEDAARNYVRAGLTLETIRKILAGVHLKPGAVECLHALRQEGVLVAVVSYSCKQFVHELLWNNGVDTLIERIYALDLHFERGVVTGFNPHTTVYPSVKGVWSRHFAREFGIDHRHLLAVGDTHGDRHLGSRKRNRLGLMNEGEATELLRKVVGHLRPGKTFHPAKEWIFERLRR